MADLFSLNSGLEKIFKGANIIPYMPDQVIRESKPDAVRGFLVAAVTIAVFLPVSIRVFDKKRRQINLFTHSL